MSDTHALTVRFVRETMIREQEPPLAEKGAVKWVRENLLSSWLNVLLTLGSLYVIYAVLAAVIPWFFNSVWDARSLSECREVFLVTGAPSGGACWAVLQERGIQLIYGFYPANAYWRPNLALILFFVALAPVLFSDRVPSRMLIFTVIYPFLMPWLLWGGAFWTPLLVVAGLGVGYLAWRFVGQGVGPLAGGIAAIVAAILWWLFAVPALNDTLYRLSTTLRLDNVSAAAQGTRDTLQPQIALLEERREGLRSQIAELEAEKAAAYEPIEQAVEEARAQATAAFYAAMGVDPEGDTPIGPSLREEARHAGQLAAREASRAPEFESEREAFQSSVSALVELRNEVNSISSELNILQDRQSWARSVMSNLSQLPERQAQIDQLNSQLSDLEAEVPSNLQGLMNVNAAPPGTPDEDIAALSALLSTQDQLSTLENAVNQTYRQAGLIGLRPVEDRAFGGFMLALIIGLSGIILSLPLGILLALGRQSDLFIINKVSITFIEIIRGVPLIVWLFTAQLLLNYFLPPGSNFSLLLRVIIMVTLFASAYIAEVVRGGLAALPRGQYEAADALGLDYWRSMRLIILPQALKVSIPGIVNTFIGLFKDTTLVVFIGLLDPIGLSNTIRASTDWNGIYWELFFFIGLMFFIFCFSMGRYSLSLEKKLSREHR